VAASSEGSHGGRTASTNDDGSAALPRLCCLCRETDAQRPTIETLAELEHQMQALAPPDSVALGEGEDAASKAPRPKAPSDPSPTTLGLNATGLLEGISLDVNCPNADNEVESPSKGEMRVRVSRTEVQERARNSAKITLDLEHPDFNGTWKMVECEGDFDGFMKEMGVGWALRKAAQAVGYGCGSTYHTVQHDNDKINVVTKNPKGTFTRDFRIDGSEQDDVDPVEKKPLKVVPYWEIVEGSLVLMVEAYMPMPNGDPRKYPLTRRYMRDKSMIVEQVSPRGIRIMRVFIKQ